MPCASSGVISCAVTRQDRTNAFNDSRVIAVLRAPRPAQILARPGKPRRASGPRQD